MSADLPPLLREFVLDVETVSWKDDEPAFDPWRGHRVAGIGYADLNGDGAWYLPIRHISGGNLPLGQVQEWLRELFKRALLFVNHNIKFDCKFLHHEGVDVLSVPLADTMVLGRLVHNDLVKYSLDALGQHFLGEGKAGDPIKAFLKSIGSKDYGRVPANVMAPYCLQDVRLTRKLYHHLLKNLPAESQAVWATEQRLTSELLRCELDGIRVDERRMKETYRDCLKVMLAHNEAINTIAGWEVEPSKDSHLNQLLIGQLGIEPRAYTETGKPQWNRMAFESMTHPIGAHLAKWSIAEHLMGTYCRGWLDITVDGVMHPNFKQSGTRTGRLSCEAPNMQNIPPEAEVFIHPSRPGDVIAAFDYSQIEYRIFGHYTQDPTILKRYEADPDADFHQMLADMLGVPRQFAKSMNFAFIYGMGKAKLLASLASIITLSNDENMNERMRTFLTGAAKASAERAQQMVTTVEAQAIAVKLYDEYHRRLPSIRKFSKMVTSTADSRGWIKNLKGRVYRRPPHSSHMMVNWVIQGSAADIFKERLVALMPWARERYGARMIANVHDSLFVSLPRAACQDYMEEAPKVLQAVNLRIPLLVAGKVSAGTWGQVQKVKKSTDVPAALEASLKAEIRQWNV